MIETLHLTGRDYFVEADVLGDMENAESPTLADLQRGELLVSTKWGLLHLSVDAARLLIGEESGKAGFVIEQVQNRKDRQPVRVALTTVRPQGVAMTQRLTVVLRSYGCSRLVVVERAELEGALADLVSRFEAFVAERDVIPRSIAAAVDRAVTTGKRAVNPKDSPEICRLAYREAAAAAAAAEAGRAKAQLRRIRTVDAPEADAALESGVALFHEAILAGVEAGEPEFRHGKVHIAIRAVDVLSGAALGAAVTALVCYLIMD